MDEEQANAIVRGAMAGLPVRGEGRGRPPSALSQVTAFTEIARLNAPSTMVASFGLRRQFSNEDNDAVFKRLVEELPQPGGATAISSLRDMTQVYVQRWVEWWVRKKFRQNQHKPSSRDSANREAATLAKLRSYVGVDGKKHDVSSGQLRNIISTWSGCDPKAGATYSAMGKYTATDEQNEIQYVLYGLYLQRKADEGSDAVPTLWSELLPGNIDLRRVEYKDALYYAYEWYVRGTPAASGEDDDDEDPVQAAVRKKMAQVASERQRASEATTDKNLATGRRMLAEARVSADAALHSASKGSMEKELMLIGARQEYAKKMHDEAEEARKRAEKAGTNVALVAANLEPAESALQRSVLQARELTNYVVNRYDAVADLLPSDFEIIRMADDVIDGIDADNAVSVAFNIITDVPSHLFEPFERLRRKLMDIYESSSSDKYSDLLKQLVEFVDLHQRVVPVDARNVAALSMRLAKAVSMLDEERSRLRDKLNESKYQMMNIVDMATEMGRENEKLRQRLSTATNTIGNAVVLGPFRRREDIPTEAMISTNVAIARQVAERRQREEETARTVKGTILQRQYVAAKSPNELRLERKISELALLNRIENDKRLGKFPSVTDAPEKLRLVDSDELTRDRMTRAIGEGAAMELQLWQAVRQRHHEGMRQNHMTDEDRINMDISVTERKRKESAYKEHKKLYGEVSTLVEAIAKRKRDIDGTSDPRDANALYGEIRRLSEVLKREIPHLSVEWFGEAGKVRGSIRTLELASNVYDVMVKVMPSVLQRRPGAGAAREFVLPASGQYHIDIATKLKYANEIQHLIDTKNFNELIDKFGSEMLPLIAEGVANYNWSPTGDVAVALKMYNAAYARDPSSARDPTVFVRAVKERGAAVVDDVSTGSAAETPPNPEDEERHLLAQGRDVPPKHSANVAAAAAASPSMPVFTGTWRAPTTAAVSAVSAQHSGAAPKFEFPRGKTVKFQEEKKSARALELPIVDDESEAIEQENPEEITYEEED